MKKKARRKLQVVAENLVRRARAGDQNAISTIIMVRNAKDKSPRTRMAYDIIRVYVKDNPSVIETTGFEIKDKFEGESGLAVLADRESDAGEYHEMIVDMPRHWKSDEESRKLANLLASGRDIDEALISQVILNLVRYGEISFNEKGKAIIGGEEAAEKAGYKPVETVSIERKDNGKIKTAPEGEKVIEKGYVVADRGKTRPVTSREIFQAGFNNANRSDRVLKLARGMSGKARRTLQIGYILGMADRLQGMTRRNAKISSFSPMIAWELGE